MAVGYRAVLRLEKGTSAVATAEQQLYSWLSGKRQDRRSGVDTADWDGAGRHRLGEQAFLDVVHDDSGEARRCLYRFTESNPMGTWSVTVYALDGLAGESVLVVENGLEGVEPGEAIERIAPPKLVTNILETVTVRDGGTVLHGRPWLARDHDVDTVLDAIRDPKRVAPVLVAASFAPDLDQQWRTVTESLARQCVGVISAFTVSHGALDEVNRRLPAAYQIGPGRIRTFLPGVDLDNEDDARRHKILGPTTLERSLDGSRVAKHLANRLARTARRQLLEFELPSEIRRGIDLLRRAEARLGLEIEVEQRVSRAEETPEPPEQAVAETVVELDVAAESVPQGAVDAAGRLVKRWLGVEVWGQGDIERIDLLLATKEAQSQVAREQLELAEQRMQELEGDLRRARSVEDDLQLNWAIASGEAQDLEYEVQVLRQRLIRAGRAEETFVEEDEDWSPPVNIEELVNRITEGKNAHVAMRRVVFTGDEAKALEIDDRVQFEHCAKRMWTYVRVLHDYAEQAVAGFKGGVHTYLTNDQVDGFKCSDRNHSPTESESVLSRPAWRAERELPVPEAVCAEGRVVMAAHFKMNGQGQFAPRLHYYDDTAGTGKIYIGYIGRHLTNTLTS